MSNHFIEFMEMFGAILENIYKYSDSSKYVPLGSKQFSSKLKFDCQKCKQDTEYFCRTLRRR